MQDRPPQGDPPFLDQILILDSPDPLPFEDVMDQAFVSPQERLQTVSGNLPGRKQKCPLFESGKQVQ